MKRRTLAPILLLAVMVFATCTKESGSSVPVSSQSQAQSSASEDDAISSVAYDFTGNYILHWSFTCGLYSTVGIYLILMVPS